MVARQDNWDVYSILEALRRRWTLVLACVILVPAAAVALSLSQPKKYTATVSVLFRNPGFDQVLFGAQVLGPSTDPTREAATNVRLIGLPIVADLTGKALGESGAAVSSKISVSAQGDSDVDTVAATDSTPAAAARLADTYANHYVTFRRTADQDKVLGAVKRLTADIRNTSSTIGAAGRSDLVRMQQQLRTLAALQTGNAEVLQRAELPSSPSSPTPVRDGVLGALVGLLIGSALALILDRVDRRLRDPEEAQAAFDRPLLAHIPESQAFSRQKDRPLRGLEADVFRMLRTSLLYFNVDKDVRSILIVSASTGEGKTTVAWNLAEAAAAGGANVLLIEADMRRPAMATLAGEDRARPGLSQVLAGELEQSDVIVRVPVQWGVPQDEEEEGSGMDVMLAGPTPPNPGDLLESQRMKALIREAENRYDLVVIDSPPPRVVPDAVPLMKLVSGVIVVTRMGVGTRHAARQLRDQLENLEAPTLGIVANGVEEWRDRYAYAYAYHDNGSGFGRLRGRRRRAPA